MNCIIKIFSIAHRNIKYTVIFSVFFFLTSLWGTPSHAQNNHRLIKTTDNPKVFLVKENRRIHIPNEQVFESGGYQWDEIEMISDSEMDSIPDTALIKSPVDAKVYVIVDGEKQWIPDEDTFLSGEFAWSDIVLISQAQVDFYDEASYVGATRRDVTQHTSVEVETKTQPTYVRPDTVQVTDLGAIQNFMPRSSNENFEIRQLNNNGQILLQRSIFVGDDLERTLYTWKDGSEIAYTADDHPIMINDSGQKLVLYDWDPRFYYFVNGNEQTRVSTLGGYSTSLTDMNNTGMMVGASSVSGGGLDGGTERAVVWQDGVLTDLGTLGGNISRANAVNDDGHAVGQSKNAAGEWQAFLSQGTTMTALPSLENAIDINNNGLVLGTLDDPSVCSRDKCSVSAYLGNGQLTTLVGDVTLTEVNNHDEMIGQLYDGTLIDTIWAQYPRDQHEAISDFVDADGYAVLHVDGQTMKLNDLVEDDSIVFTTAHSINDRGEIVARGFNYEDDRSHWYRISLPKNLPPTFSFTMDGDNTVPTEAYKESEDYEEELDAGFMDPLYTIAWDDADVDSNAEIALYYYYCEQWVKDGCFDGDGNILISRISEDDELDQYTWDMRAMTPGVYYIYATITDETRTRRIESDRLIKARTELQNAKILETIGDDATEEI